MTIKVYIATDKSQSLPTKVLEHSILRHSKSKVECIKMEGLLTREPIDPRQRQRTEFSFYRFCIPALNGYSGKAIYLDPDMLVFDDIANLWNHNLEDFSLLIQKELPPEMARLNNKFEKSVTRIKQCSVMLMDCERLDWNIEEILDGLDSWKFTYDELMHQLCICKENEVGSTLPFQWNSLEHYDNTTKLIHYTDTYTQPWVYSGNKNEDVWIAELKLMLKNSKIKMEEIEHEIEVGHIRPSLLLDLKKELHKDKKRRDDRIKENKEHDISHGFVPHKNLKEKHKQLLTLSDPKSMQGLWTVLDNDD